MITKMDKYSFVVFQPEMDDFLKSLQEIGIVDITRDNKAIDSRSKELFDHLSDMKSLLKRVESAGTQIEKQLTEVTPDSKAISENDIFEKAHEALKRRDEIDIALSLISSQIPYAQKWGDFNSSDIDKIRDLGFEISFYITPVSRYNKEWEDEYIIHEINNDQESIYFALLTPKGEENKFPLKEVKFPKESINTLLASQAELEKESDVLNSIIFNIYKSKSIIENRISSLLSELDLYLAGVSSTPEAEGSLAILNGFAPTSHREEVESLLAGKGVLYLREDAAEEDNPPVKLKNNFFSKLFEPIGDLYMLPKYGELDLTPYFAPFYMLFFGFCLGDMGYGIVMLLGATLAKLKFKKMAGYLTLIQFLGVGSILMAALPGVFFGAKVAEVFNLPDSVKALFFSDLKMFWFAILFGIFQIIFARLVNAIYSMVTKGWQYGMANIGWIIFIIWASLAYSQSMIPEMALPEWFIILLPISLVMVVGFSSIKKNIVLRILSGAGSLYDVTGIFGDMLSYIRLFGLGTAGGILGLVVNSVALNMASVPYVGWLFAAIMLVIGHTAVLLLNSLGAFVHPMRLTFVEFYKNAGFSGGGRAYRPLKKDI